MTIAWPCVSKARLLRLTSSSTGLPRYRALDGELVRFAEFRREGRPWVFWLEGWDEIDHTKYMKRVASYRKQYPPFTPTIDFGKDNPMKDEMERHVQDVNNVTAEILREYGE